MPYERLDNCPVCSKTDLKNFLICKDNTVSQESFVIVECVNCSFKFTNPRPDKDSIGSYYESEDYISHSNTSSGLISKAYQTVRSITIGQKVDLINKHSQAKGKLLDYGCGTGHFLTACKKDGWQISGIEPSDKARAQAEEQTGEKIGTGDLSALEPASFDIITLWHVLEHVHDLNGLMTSFASLLKPDGKLIIAVPNSDSFDAQMYKEYWAAYDVPRHLYHFNQATMKRLLKKHKFQLVETKPMMFDSYYVSMLSEKYKQGRTNIVKSVINGLKSNLHAMQHQKNYSSLIYISSLR